MSRRALALVACVIAPPVAAAETSASTATFARGMRIDEAAVVEVQELAFRAGEYRGALVGRFKQGELTIAGVVLTWCDKKQQCWLNHVWLGAANTVVTLGLFDLGGAPGAFPIDDQRHVRELKLAGKPRWPALLVRTTRHEQTTTGSRYGGQVTGDHRRVELGVLSLSREDKQHPEVMREVVDEHWPTGVGVNVTFELAKDGQLVATEQRDIENRSACLRPDPTTTRYKLDEHRRFRRASELAHEGCR